MTAVEARALSEKNKDYLFNKGVAESLSWVEMAANEGLTSSLFPHIPSSCQKRVEEKIIELGFKISDGKMWWNDDAT